MFVMSTTLPSEPDTPVSCLISVVTTRGELSASSRDALVTLRRVEREQALIERLYAARSRLTFTDLAAVFAVSERTIARDCERLRDSGVPLEVRRGRDGGVRLDATDRPAPITFDLPEIAALMTSLTALGPSVSDSATSAMGKLTAAIGADTSPAV